MKERITARLAESDAQPERRDALDDLAALLPPGWPLDCPLARIRTCGALSVEVVIEVRSGPDGQPQAVYGPPAASLLEIKGMTTAFLLLALLASQPQCFAARDFLVQTMPRARRTTSADEETELEGDGAFKRLDNVVSLLRTLLTPPVLLSFPGVHKIRRRLVRYVRATAESGPGYRLAPAPWLWLDVEAMEAAVARARRVEARGEDGLEDWQAAYEIGMRGSFLDHEPYSEWADWRRGRVADLLWQSVRAQCQRATRWEGSANGKEVAARLLLDYWQRHMTNEDAFRALIDVLGKQERLHLAEECSRQLCAALSREGRLPQKRTQESMAALRRAGDWQEGYSPKQVSSASPAWLTARRTEPRAAPTDRSSQAVSGNEAERFLPETRHLIGRHTWLTRVSQMVQAFPAKKLLVLQGPIGIGKSSELARLPSLFNRHPMA
jgi:hypothetical protein